MAGADHVVAVVDQSRHEPAADRATGADEKAPSSSSPSPILGQDE
jgi:hypothetical protein